MAGLEFEVRVDEVRERLKAAREAEGIYAGLRPWAESITVATGYPTSPSTAMRQEKGVTRLDGEYLLAVMLAKSLSPAWLLFGEGSKYRTHAEPDAVELLDAVVEKLQRGEITAEALDELAHARRKMA